MIEQLALTLNAQFLKANAQATDDDFRTLLDAASENMVPGSMLAEEFRAPNDGAGFLYKVSLRIFKATRPVYFLPELDIVDEIYAFLLILEIDGHLVILKKGCANISDELDRVGGAIGSLDLSATVEAGAAFQKLSVRSMTVSDKAIRTRSYEAADLQGALSLHSAGRSIPYFVRVRHGTQLSSLSLNTSRLFDASDRKSVHAVAAWAREKIQKIATPRLGGFLQSFARAVDVNDVLAVSRPIAVLVESGALREMLAEEGASTPFWIKRGRRRDLTNRACDRLHRHLERVFEVASDDSLIGFKGKIKRNKRSLSLWLDVLRRIHVEINGKELTLQAFVLKNNLFSVCFSDPKFMYFMGRCFEDTSGISEVDALLDVLEVIPSLAGADSEKGAEPIANWRTRFEAQSVFDRMERLFSGDDYIFCDDMGVEWADHICLNEAQGRVAFVHSKHGDVSTSASNLHVVVGQGIKNLGNLYFDSKSFMAKVNGKWSDFYPGTRISRRRRGTTARIRPTVARMLANYRLERQCVLACDFLSKAQVSAEFQNVKRGVPVRGHVIQLLWIISSFVHAAKEMSITPKIYCVP